MSILALALVLTGDKIELKYIPTGITKKVGGYMPVRAAMGPTSKGVTKKPETTGTPSYGVIPIGSQEFAFVLDEPADGPSKLYVDSNGDGDLTNDPATVWAGRKSGNFTTFTGTAQVMVNGELSSLGVYRFDKTDPQRAQLKDTLLYYTDFGYEGMGKFGNDEFKVTFAGALTDKSSLWIDRNGNGKSDGRSESVMMGKPFNFGGTVYVLSVAGDGIEIGTSSETVAEIPLPPDLSVGRDVPKFEAVAMNGKKIDFPTTFKGKVVMLDFWATWCGPCIAELPNVIKAYEKYKDKGFDVLGISFDQANMAEKVTTFTKEHNMPWMQIYEGKYWETTLGLQFGVQGIPFCLLIDGDTGKILATVDKLRGENLDKTLEQVMANRGQ